MSFARPTSRRRVLRWIALITAASVASLGVLPAQKKKNKKEEETQTLQVPAELPSAVAGSTRKLTFHVTPLSPKGLLSAQIREALKALFRQCSGETILKIRAFVAGSGDVRRVRDLVSDVFADRHLPPPALSLVRSGGLPLEGAQVVLEAVAAARKDVNPHGLVFISPHVATSDNPLDPVAPLSKVSLNGLAQAVRAAGAEPADVVRVTCFLSSLENLAATRSLVEAEYPRAALNYVQTQRAPLRGIAACEAVARLRSDPAGGLQLVNLPEEPVVPGQSRMALVNTAEVLLTGGQVSFGYQEQDGRLAMERLDRELQKGGASRATVAFAHYYPLSQGIAEQVRKLRATVFDNQHAPAGTLLQFEGLTSMDAAFAVDVVAAKR